MPEAVDPGIASGFRAADQQSYLQQVLANTRASQENAARLKEEQEQMFVDPSVFQHGDGAKMASGATPDGKLIFKSPVHFGQARDLDKTKYDEKASLDANYDVAQNAIRSGLVDPKHPAWPHVQTAASRGRLTPEGVKMMADVGKLGAHQPKPGLPGVDAWGRPISPAISPARNNALPLDVQKAQDEGHEVSTHYDKEGNVTYTVKQTVDSGDSLASYVKANYEGRTFNALSPDEKKDARAAWRLERRADMGKDQSLKISVAQEGELNKPVGTKDILKYYSYDKGWAADIVGMEKLPHSQLVAAGFYNRDTGEGAQKFAKDEKTFGIAEAHIKQAQNDLSQIAERRPDLYPDWDPSKPSSSVARAKALQVWRNAWLSDSDPDVAYIKSLDHASMRLQAALNPVGTRFGLGMLYYAADGSPTSSKAPFTKQALYANLDAWKRNIAASREGLNMSGQRSGKSVSHAPPFGAPGYVPPGHVEPGYKPYGGAPSTSVPNSAGVSGSSPFKKWFEKRGVR